MLSRQLYRSSQVASARVAVVSARGYATKPPTKTPPPPQPKAQPQQAAKPSQPPPQQAAGFAKPPQKTAASGTLSKHDFYVARQDLPLRLYSRHGLLASRLYVLAERVGKAQVDEVGKSLAALGKELEAHPKINTFLASPANTPEQKKLLISKLADPLKLNSVLVSFLNELADARRGKLIPKIVKQFEDLLNARDKVVHVKLTKASQDQPQPTEAIVKEVLKYSPDTKVVLDVVVDPKIVGGAILQSKDRYVDKSFRSEINSLREELAKRENKERSEKRSEFMKQLQAVESFDFSKAQVRA